MITHQLGWQIDISCGGIDNLKRHHDYTIAVIEGITGQEFAHYWLHGGHVLADGVKMSKSRGNIMYLEELLNKGFSSAQVRFFLITRHYRKKLNLTMRKVTKAAQRLKALREIIERIEKHKSPAGTAGDSGLPEKLTEDFEERMNDDLDINGAIRTMESNLGAFMDLIHSARAGSRECQRMMRHIRNADSVLQVLQQKRPAGAPERNMKRK